MTEKKSKKLYRDIDNAVFKGVLAGFGQYYHTDPVLIRVFFVLGLVITGLIPGVIAYLVAVVLMPVHDTIDAQVKD
jgi:phage shock protein C